MFDTIFNNENYHDFYSPQIMKDEIDQKNKKLIIGLDKNDPTYEASKGWYKRGRPWLYSIFTGQTEKNRKKRKFLDIDDKKKEAVSSDRTKMVL